MGKKKNKIRSRLDFNILLLGAENVGKTEIGNILSRTKRTHYEPTNGVQCFVVDLLPRTVSITEIGGNCEMQKLWHHYYKKTMGLIFCYDMSSGLQEMRKSFQLLNQITAHPFMQGKPVLVVGTKSDMVSDTVQLYDIENTFALEALANRHFSSLKSAYFNPCKTDSLWSGVNWLVCFIESNQDRLRGRINYDVMRDRLQQTKKSSTRSFSISLRRPKTAPAKICVQVTPSSSQVCPPKAGDQGKPTNSR